MRSVLSPELIQIHAREVPDNAADVFWHRSIQYTKNKEGMEPSDFPLLLRVEKNEVETYIAHHEKRYGSANIEDTELETYFVDVIEQSEVVGVGEMLYFCNSKRSYHKQKPYVGWTETYDDYRKEGRAKERLITMNEAAISIHGLTLHSSTAFCHRAAVKAWQRLVSENLATSYTEGDTSVHEGIPRYCFLSEEK